MGNNNDKLGGALGGDCRAGGDRDWIELRDEFEAGGVGEIFVEALEIFCVERVIDVGAEIEGEFFFGELEFARSFGADFRKMGEAIGQ